MDVGNMLDKIVRYNKVLEEYGYLKSGDGKAPWSIRYTNKDTGWYIDIRNSEWKFFAGKIIITGPTTDGLKRELKEFQESKA